MNAALPRRKRLWLLNLAFFAVCCGILCFLLLAPPVRTPKMPQDKDHIPFRAMPRKAAEKQCAACHGPDTAKPLPETHPPPYRCLFCHRMR